MYGSQQIAGQEVDRDPVLRMQLFCRHLGRRGSESLHQITAMLYANVNQDRHVQRISSLHPNVGGCKLLAAVQAHLESLEIDLPHRLPIVVQHQRRDLHEVRINLQSKNRLLILWFWILRLLRIAAGTRRYRTAPRARSPNSLRVQQGPQHRLHYRRISLTKGYNLQGTISMEDIEWQWLSGASLRQQQLSL